MLETSVHMKKIAVLALTTTLVTVFTGCVPITYQKTVTVRKDASGKVIETVETESITEPHSEMSKIKAVDSTSFEHLK